MPFLASPARFLWHYLSARPWPFLLLAALVIGAASGAVGVQYAMKLLVDAMAAAHHARFRVYAALGGLVALVVVESVLLRAAAITLGHATVVSGVRIRLDMVDYLTGHQMPFFQQQRAGSLGHRVTVLSSTFGALVHRIFQEVLPPLIAFGGAAIIFFSIDARLGVVLSVVFVAVTAALVVLGLRGHLLHQDYAERSGKVGGELVDVIGNMGLVKAFAARGRELRRLRGFLRAESVAQRRGWFFVERMRGLHDLALAVLVAGVLFWAIGRWSDGLITIGDVVVISSMTFRMLYGSRDLAMALIDTSQQFSYLQEALDVLGVPQTLVDAADAPALSVGEGSVRFENVTFGYDPRRPVLHDVTLEVPAGQKLGIVGASGAGKSSLVQLVQRFHDPQAGAVWLDGQRVDAVTQESLRDALAAVPQEVLLFHRTVRENIRFARPGATDEEVARAAEAANCGFIDDLQEGWDSVVGERGASLSGGQRQRIGIARAFLKDAPVVLLDEATSALDTESELEVQRGLDALMANRTVIAVAHRLSTIAGFDRVIVMDAGRIVEDGPPQRLLARGDGAFRRLWTLQAEGLDAPAPKERPARRGLRLVPAA